MRDRRPILRSLFDAGVAAVSAGNCLPPHLPDDEPKGRCAMIAVGKAAGAMAQAALTRMRIDDGLVILPKGHMPAGWQVPPHIRVIEASHPAPDARSLEAGNAALQLAHSLGSNDRLIALVSGGGSALMAAPAIGVGFEEKQAVTRALLACGAPISDINRVRSALSRVKGGRLAQVAAPAQVLTYVISDIPGDNPALVASGPTLTPDSGKQPLDILRQYGIEVSKAVANVLDCMPSPVSVSGEAIVCARAADALSAMATEVARLGYMPVLLGDALEGDAEALAHEHAAMALQARQRCERVALISGGEVTVRLRNPDGRGGRNTTYALALSTALNNMPGIAGFAADSDGIDGNSNAAGAYFFPCTLERLGKTRRTADVWLRSNDSHSAFSAIGDLLITGPTCTNVNDLRVILVDGA